jgi:hypothetical protein
MIYERLLIALSLIPVVGAVPFGLIWAYHSRSDGLFNAASLSARKGWRLHVEIAGTIRFGLDFSYRQSQEHNGIRRLPIRVNLRKRGDTGKGRRDLSA